MALAPNFSLGPSDTWGRWVTSNLQNFEREQDRNTQAQTNLNKQINSSINQLQQQINDIAAVNSILVAVAQINYAEFTTGLTGFTGWYPTPPAQATITTPTGRIEIGFGGALNGGDGYFCYQIRGATSGRIIVARETVQGNPAQRVAVSGGASFTPSGFKSVVLDSLPTTEQLVVTLEVFSSSTFVLFAGGSIQVRVAP